jgi:hypothetical protein
VKHEAKIGKINQSSIANKANSGNKMKLYTILNCSNRGQDKRKKKQRTSGKVENK